MKKTSKISIVIPTNRHEQIKTFLSKWENEFKHHNVIIVEDNPQKSFDLPNWVEHYSWQEIDKELGKNSWIIPRRCAAIRSYGFIKAWQKKADYIITLDDDCLPEKGSTNFVDEVVKRLDTDWEDDHWWSTFKHNDIYPRGYPYQIRKQKQKTVIHHGLWSNIPDLDGITQKKHPDFRFKPKNEVVKVPYGKFFPMCSMNLSFKRKALPLIYMLLMGEDKKGSKWGYDRFDDIWAGIFAKKICDHLVLAISSGAPNVIHTRASNINTNIKKEAEGMNSNEWLWKEISKVNLKNNSINKCYLELANVVKSLGKYWKKLSIAMKIWISYLENEPN